MTGNPPAGSLKISEAHWTALSQKRILFGHQSVGFNILEGCADVMKENPHAALRIVETDDPRQFDAPIFAHAKVGRNRDPKSKCDAFRSLLQTGIGDRTDIALLKFCYVDITAQSNVHDVFKYYLEMTNEVKGLYPNLGLIHVTCPLTRTAARVKAMAKTLLGRPVGGYADNVRRNEFNELLRNAFQGKQSLFDLAAVESTYPDGRRCSFRYRRRNYFSLAPQYTCDGGHLNATGRRAVAEKLLIFLADIR